MREPLTSDQLHAVMAEHPHWEVREGQLVRSIQAPSFAAAIRFVDAVAETAEEHDHHPDIDIRWTTVTFALATWSAGGITGKDVELAAVIDTLSDQLT